MKSFLLMLVALLAVTPRSLHASEFKNCDKAWRQVKRDWNDDTALLRSARDYQSHCSAVMDTPQRVRLLGHMGEALIHTKQYSEAIPILQLCTKHAAAGLSGDYAICWEELGEAAAYTGACTAALTAFKEAQSVPAIDNLSVDAHELADLWLKSLSTQKCSAAEQAGDSRSSAPAGHTYGTAFFIAKDGLLLTNDHVVHSCHSLTVGAGTNAQVLSRDSFSDLALLKSADKAPGFVRFRSGKPVSVGEPVIAFGFPLPGTLSSDGTATSGIISSLRGFHDDSRSL